LAIDKPIHFSKPSSCVINRLSSHSSFVFALVVTWKAVLLLGFALPPPSNDSFFYDGPVVNLLLHGHYMNPSLAEALPISGTQVFSAYPPLYQFTLAVWMTVFGISAFSAMSLHFVLFSSYAWVLWATLRQLEAPARAINTAGLFLLAITFHDRPDSLAHLFGILAIYSCVRGWRISRWDEIGHSRVKWLLLMAFFAILGIATGLQIGALYIFLLWVACLLRRYLANEPMPLIALGATVVVPGFLVGMVVVAFPGLWQGFLEHARQTPSFTGFRLPKLDEWLKVLRNVPGLLAVACLLCLAVLRQSGAGRRLNGFKEFWPPGGQSSPSAVIVLLLACTISSICLTAASLTVLTPNAVSFVFYLQPLVVAAYLTCAATQFNTTRPGLFPWGLFLALASLVSIRAVGLSTWGVACARDFGYLQAKSRVQTQLAACKTNATVVLSSAYLYEAARFEHVKLIHSDWMTRSERASRNTDWEGLLKLKPEMILLTPFDYYRRYEVLLERLREHPELASFEVTLSSRLTPPDAHRSIQRVLQHVSWAPVTIRILWN
jgi:hypothetical protein